MSGCASCLKRKLVVASQPADKQLESAPQAISKHVVAELKKYVAHNIGVRDRMGKYTSGLCVDVWVDEEEEGFEHISIGNVALQTKQGALNLIGFNIIEDIDLLD